MSIQDTRILGKAAETVYSRPDAHGEPEDSFETIGRLWHDYLYAKMGDSGSISVDAEDVANMMILLKVARNAEGHYHEDNYVDIAGYAENGDRLADSGDEDSSPSTPLWETEDVPENEKGSGARVSTKDFEFDEYYTMSDLKRNREGFPRCRFNAVPSGYLAADGFRAKVSTYTVEYILENEDEFKFGANYVFVPVSTFDDRLEEIRLNTRVGDSR